MAAAKPFLFDRDFDGRRRGEEMVPMSQHLATISESEQRGFDAGFSDRAGAAFARSASSRPRTRRRSPNQAPTPKRSAATAK